MARRFFSGILLLVTVLVVGACDSDDPAPTIDGDLAISVEGPPNTEGQLRIVFFDEGQASNESQTDITIPSSGEFNRDIEDGHDGVRVQVQVPRGTSVVLTLLSNGAVFAEDDAPESLLSQEVYEVEVGNVPSRPTPDAGG